MVVQIRRYFSNWTSKWLVLFHFFLVGNEKIIKLLVQNNATNINAIDASGHTALDAVVTSSESKLKLQSNGFKFYGFNFMDSNFVKKIFCFFSPNHELLTWKSTKNSEIC